jgi:aminobenzoyl-glutamate utilization protein B
MSLLIAALLAAAPAKPAAPTPLTRADVRKKQAAAASVEAHKAELVSLSDQVWAFAETALRETRSAGLLAEYAEKQGFRVERGIAGMPTAFVASYGEGAPVIAVMGEYDALPGLSQKATSDKSPLVAGAPGHGCGHNLFGAASLGAATAIKELIAAGRLKGTVRFYGTPAEEDVGGKAYMARDGVFRDVDVALAWHPADRNRADMHGGQAMVDMLVEFKGKAAHAAVDPWNGRSAVDAVELFTHAVNLMREHVKPTVRIHYVITAGGDVPNVVPELGRVWIWVREFDRAELDGLIERLRSAMQGAALAAGVQGTLKIQAGDLEILINETGERMLDANLRLFGPIRYTPEEEAFARALQTNAGVEARGMDTAVVPLDSEDQEGGSTDVGDVSWVTPTLHVSVATAPRGVPWHAWPVVAAGGMSIGHKGLVLAAETLAATMIDLFEDPAARAAVRAEFQQKTKGYTYRPYIPDGPPALPKN